MSEKKNVKVTIFHEGLCPVVSGVVEVDGMKMDFVELNGRLILSNPKASAEIQEAVKEALKKKE